MTGSGLDYLSILNAENETTRLKRKLPSDYMVGASTGFVVGILGTTIVCASLGYLSNNLDIQPNKTNAIQSIISSEGKFDNLAEEQGFGLELQVDNKYNGLFIKPSGDSLADHQMFNELRKNFNASTKYNSADLTAKFTSNSDSLPTIQYIFKD